MSVQLHWEGWHIFFSLSTSCMSREVWELLWNWGKKRNQTTKQAVCAFIKFNQVEEIAVIGISEHRLRLAIATLPWLKDAFKPFPHAFLQSWSAPYCTLKGNDLPMSTESQPEHTGHTNSSIHSRQTHRQESHTWTTFNTSYLLGCRQNTWIQH